MVGEPQVFIMVGFVRKFFVVLVYSVNWEKVTLPEDFFLLFKHKTYSRNFFIFTNQN